MAETQDSRAHLVDHGWAWQRGLLPADAARRIGSDLMSELGNSDEPLLRVLTSRVEPHVRDRSGRITNPVIHPGRLPTDRFSHTHGVEQRVFALGPVVRWATELLDAPVALLQSGWWPSSVGTPWHRDVNPLNAVAPMLGVWIALEDIVHEAGPFVVFNGSHRVSEGSELEALMTSSDALYTAQYVQQVPHEPGAVTRVHRALTHAMAEHGMAPVIALLSCGDAMAWDSRAVHGSETPGPTGRTRNSLLLHFIRQQDLPAPPD